LGFALGAYFLDRLNRATRLPPEQPSDYGAQELARGSGGDEPAVPFPGAFLVTR